MKRLFSLICAALILTTSSAAVATQVIHQERSQYRNIIVTQDRGERCLAFVGAGRQGRESCMLLAQPDKLVFEYTQVMMGALLVQPHPREILILGLGGGTLPKALRRAVPGAHITVAEIDPAVLSVCERYFNLKPDNDLSVATQDGRVFVNAALRQHKRYDIVMLDAFDLNYIPDHLMTREFLTSVSELLAPGGVLAANTFSTSRLYNNESVTYEAVFHRFFNIKRENRLIFAAPGGLPNLQTMRANAAIFAKPFADDGVDGGALAAAMKEDPDWDRRARILTDQYSPANLLNHLGR
jgi:spermidine synthase